MTLQNWTESGNHFNYKNHRIFYQIAGEGEKIILIHGKPGASYDWRKVWKKLYQKHQVIALDLIGFGNSEKPVKYDYSIPDQADLIEVLMKILGIETCHIVAHGYGSLVAQELLSRYESKVKDGRNPIKIQSLSLISPFIFPNKQKTTFREKIHGGSLGTFITLLQNKSKFSSSYQRLFAPETQPTKEDVEAIWELKELDEGYRMAHRLMSYLTDQKKARRTWLRALRNTLVKTQIVYGKQDPRQSKKIKTEYEINFPDFDLIPIETGHYPHLEQSELVFEKVNQLIKANKAKTKE